MFLKLEENKMKQNHKTSKGITLIILIVTVIILMILAGTSMTLISRHNAAKIAQDAIDNANDKYAEDEKMKNELLSTEITEGIKGTTLPSCKHEFGSWDEEAQEADNGTCFITRTCTKCNGVEYKKVYKVTYTGINTQGKDYPRYIDVWGKLNVTFEDDIPYNVVPYIDGLKLEYNKYNYENGTLVINNVEGNVEIKYIEKAYIRALPIGGYFKNSTYLTNIKTVSFVKGVYDKNAIKIWDLTDTTKTSAGTVIAWLDNNCNLYIGSDFEIYTTNLSYAFYNMSGVTKITFDNLNIRENTITTYTAMFFGISNTISITVKDAAAATFINARLAESNITGATVTCAN